MRIGADVDGCLARFNSGFLRLLNALHHTERSFDPFDDAVVWGWPHLQCGFTEEQVDAGWAYIDRYPGFWNNLDAYPRTEEALKTLYRWSQSGDLVYFITQRQPDRAAYYTRLWLERYGFPGASVILSGEKGRFAASLGLDAVFDDRIENLEDVAQESPSTTRILVRRLHNVHVAHQPSLHEALDVAEALELIKIYARPPHLLSH